MLVPSLSLQVSVGSQVRHEGPRFPNMGERPFYNPNPAREEAMPDKADRMRLDGMHKPKKKGMGPKKMEIERPGRVRKEVARIDTVDNPGNEIGGAEQVLHRDPRKGKAPQQRAAPKPDAAPKSPPKQDKPPEFNRNNFGNAHNAGRRQDNKKKEEERRDDLRLLTCWPKVCRLKFELRAAVLMSLVNFSVGPEQ